MCIFMAFHHRMFFDHFLSEFSHFFFRGRFGETCGWLPEDDELLLFSSASILVRIASSMFVFFALCFYFREACVVFVYCGQSGTECCREAVVILLRQSFHIVFELLDHAVHYC